MTFVTPLSQLVIRKCNGGFMDKVRVGVVGVGALGQHHARVYASLPEAELVGIVDPFPGRAEEIAKPLGTEVFSGHSELFGKVDAVSIATPTTLHAEIGEQLLKAGGVDRHMVLL